MKASKPLAFVVLAFVVGATISQASFAFADDSTTNPFRAIWVAISDLQTKTQSLQSQIDDLKAMRGVATTEQAPGKVSELSVAIEVGGGNAGQTVIQVLVKNSGPENAVGVKLSTYYQMSLFKINSINGAECSDQARGIIECYLATIDVGSEAKVLVYMTPLALGQQAVITSDISSITDDANPTNNHTEAVFTTSSSPVVIQPAPPTQLPSEPATVQPVQEQPAAQQLSNSTQVTNSTQNGSTSEQPATQQGNETQAVRDNGTGSNQTSTGPSENPSAPSSSGSNDSGASGSASSGESGSPSSSDSGSSNSTSSGNSGTSNPAGSEPSGGNSGSSLGNAAAGSS